MASLTSFYVICREATTCNDFERWRVVAIRDGKVDEGLNDFGYRSVRHAVRAYRRLGLPMFTEDGPIGKF